jgi:hypothetical protein
VPGSVFVIAQTALVIWHRFLINACLVMVSDFFSNPPSNPAINPLPAAVVSFAITLNPFASF